MTRQYEATRAEVDPLRVLERHNEAQRPGVVSVASARALVFGIDTSLHHHRTSHQFIPRFTIAPFVPDPIFEAGGGDASGPDAGQEEFLVGDAVESGFRALDGPLRVMPGRPVSILTLQPGSVYAALRRDSSRFGLAEIVALIGVKDVSLIRELQNEILPDGALFDEKGKPVEWNFHRIFHRRLQDLKREAAGNALLLSAIACFDRVNVRAASEKEKHVRDAQREVLRTKHGAAGRVGLLPIEKAWADECGLSLDPSVDVYGDLDYVESIQRTVAAGGPVPPQNVVINLDATSLAKLFGDQGVPKAEPVQAAAVTEAQLASAVERGQQQVLRSLYERGILTAEQAGIEEEAEEAPKTGMDLDALRERVAYLSDDPETVARYNAPLVEESGDFPRIESEDGTPISPKETSGDLNEGFPREDEGEDEPLPEEDPVDADTYDFGVDQARLDAAIENPPPPSTRRVTPTVAPTKGGKGGRR